MPVCVFFAVCGDISVLLVVFSSTQQNWRNYIARSPRRVPSRLRSWPPHHRALSSEPCRCTRKPNTWLKWWNAARTTSWAASSTMVSFRCALFVGIFKKNRFKFVSIWWHDGCPFQARWLLQATWSAWRETTTPSTWRTPSQEDKASSCRTNLHRWAVCHREERPAECPVSDASPPRPALTDRTLTGSWHVTSTVP